MLPQDLWTQETPRRFSSLKAERKAQRAAWATYAGKSEDVHGKITVLWWFYGGFIGFYGIYPVVNAYTTMERSTMFNGEINY